MDKPNFMTLAKDLNANVLRCIEGVLEKHSAAILSELYDDVQRQKALTAAQQQGQAVYQIENDPDEWFDVDRAMYEGHDGSRKRILYSATPPPSAPVGVAKAWQEGYSHGVQDERTSEDNIGIAGFNAKVEPARVNPYLAQQPAAVDEARVVETIRKALHHSYGAGHTNYANFTEALDYLATQHQEPTT